MHKSNCVLVALAYLLHVTAAANMQLFHVRDRTSTSSISVARRLPRATAHAEPFPAPHRNSSQRRGKYDIMARQSNSSGNAITPMQLEQFKLYSEYNAAAYCGPQQQAPGGKVTCGAAGVCPRVEAHATTIYHAWVELGDTGATGYVAFDASDNAVVLSMRGSVSLANWVTDLQFFQKSCDDYVPGAFCGSGFMDYWEESKTEAFTGITKVLTDHPTAKIIVTGHSLGGAAAVYATIELRKQYGVDRVTLYTYGQPRAGDAKLSQYITDQGNNYRITHTDDGVPKLPPEEVPIVSLASGVYRHLSPEYWISHGLGNDITSFKKLEGLSNFDGNAGTGQLNLNIISHIQYFQTNMYYCVLPLPLELLGGAGT